MIYEHPLFVKLHLSCNSKWIEGVRKVLESSFLSPPFSTSPYLMVYDPFTPASSSPPPFSHRTIYTAKWKYNAACSKDWQEMACDFGTNIKNPSWNWSRNVTIDIFVFCPNICCKTIKIENNKLLKKNYDPLQKHKPLFEGVRWKLSWNDGGVSDGFRRGLYGKTTGDVENFLFKICQLGLNYVGQ